jgi:iron complex transport system ATP-binding protein
MDRHPAAVEAHALSWADARGRRVLDAIDLAVGADERVAIVGPNGAGKSTLLRLLAGRLRPAGGTLHIAGRPLAAMTDRERARTVATLAQDEAIDGRFLVREYVALGRLPYRGAATRHEHDAAIDDAIRACGVATLADRSLSTLSGGERQRVRLARAIAQQPGVLLLDEPTNHLDLAARMALLDLIAGLGLAVVAVVHELSLLPRFADRVLVIDRGRAVACGPPDAVMAPDLVRRIFGLDVYHAVHPASGARTLAFDRSTA